ncbi:MAG: hypothetical protein II661_09965 [Bacteroidales bacterium]|nr:hypothetical protein [Bacteroidales bacterium]
MTLSEVIRAIEKVALQQPDVRTIVRNDIYRLNAMTAVRYGVFSWLQEEHVVQVDGSLRTYGFTFFFADRLTNGGGNEVEVQSEGVEVLTNIIRQLADLGIVASTEVALRSFNERFSDACAGVYARVRLEVPEGWTCPFDYNVQSLINEEK